jgi:hypothetical protein
MLWDFETVRAQYLTISTKDKGGNRWVGVSIRSQTELDNLPIVVWMLMDGFKTVLGCRVFIG